VLVASGVFGAHVTASRKRTLRALRASEAELRATVAAQRQAALDLERSEQQLRHAQKIEAVGHLVAGVAHNFNNLLTVTMGYTDLLMDRHPPGDPDRDQLDEIRRATDRGATLTRHLLTYGHKHVARRERLDLNHIVAELRDILGGLIREDIALTIDVPAAPVSIAGDPHDIEQVVLNLVLNARDALPSGGSIHIDVGPQRIDAANAPKDVAATPGDYVRLSVRDDGIGMTPEVQAHLFEPFFTTKEVGEGTGLGLAFVHGIARMAGGFVTIDTAPGKGTTVCVYFQPARDMANEAPAPPPPAPAPAAARPRRYDSARRRRGDRAQPRRARADAGRLPRSSGRLAQRSDRAFRAAHGGDCAAAHRRGDAGDARAGAGAPSRRDAARPAGPVHVGLQRFDPRGRRGDRTRRVSRQAVA
jgi:signal transduction histidine kinase